MGKYNDVFLDALNISPQNATPIGIKPDSTPSAPNYNALLWKKVNTDRSMIHVVGNSDGGYDDITNDGSFFTVATFSGDTSPSGTNLTGNLIYNNFTEMSFDNSGNLRTKSLNNVEYIWKNPLTKSSWNVTNDAENAKFGKRNDIVVSNNGKFILMRDLGLSTSNNQIYYVLYNPIHSIAYQKFYRSINDRVKRLSDPLPHKYTEIMADKTKNPLYDPRNPTATTSTVYQQYNWNGTGNYDFLKGDGKRNYGDIACNLLYNRECVNFAAGGGLNIPFDSSSYGDLSNNCSCSATSLSSSLGTKIGVGLDKMKDSFITDFTLDAHAAKNQGEKECPKNLQINNCTMTNNISGDSTETNVTKVMLCGVTPTDCKYDPPTIEWSECVPNPDGKVKDGKLGTKKATQKIAQQALGGAACKTPNSQGIIETIQPCDPPPIDCVFTEWEDKGKRDAQCGIGSIVQTRNIKVRSAYGGTCGPYNDRGETILTRVVNYDTGVPCSNSSSTPSSTQSPTQTPAQSTTSSVMTTSPTSSNTMIYAAVGVVVLGIGIYFYLSKKAK